jgi:predicted carbohydrate-binding protein with CBM5 and CBM33 domain
MIKAVTAISLAFHRWSPALTLLCLIALSVLPSGLTKQMARTRFNSNDTGIQAPTMSTQRGGALWGSHPDVIISSKNPRSKSPFQSSDWNKASTAKYSVDPTDLSLNTVFSIPQTLPDLTTSASAVGGTSYTRGQSNVQSQVTVFRTGGSLPVDPNFPYVEDRLYFSTNSSWDTGDTLLWTSNGSTPDYPVSTLNSNGSKTVTATYNIPSVSTGGTYYIISVVDGVPSPNGYYAESNESNNRYAYAISVTVPTTLPDLTTSASAVGSTSLTAGQSNVQSHVTVFRSGGSLPVDPNFPYVEDRLYFSTNSSWDSGDTLLWTSNGSTPDYPVSTLNSSGSKTVTATYNIPSVSTGGTYYIISVVDGVPTPNGYYAESNESNNRYAYAVSVTVPTTLPDLTTSASAVGSTSLTAGQSSVQSQVTVFRSGGSLPVDPNFPYVEDRLYFSTNSSWDTGDTLLWTSNGSTPDYPVSTLNSSGSKTVTATYNIPSVSTGGTYYIISVVDGVPSPNGYYAESNESNNRYSYAISVTVPTTLPDLTTSASAVGSTSLTAGQSNVQSQVPVFRSGGSLPVDPNFPYVEDRLYFSTNSSWDTGDTLLWTSNGSTPDYPVSTLNSSGSKTVTATYNIPSVSTGGTYYIISVVDGVPSPNGYYSESNENNNFYAYAVTISLASATPTISNLTTSPSPPIIGQPFNFTITGLNYNTSNAEVFFLGPGCSTATSCVVAPTRAATTLTGAAVLADGYFTVQVRNGSGGSASGTWPLIVNPGASTPTIGNMATSPNSPLTGQQFNFTITGLNYNTSNAEVFFLGPGCSTAASCVVTPTRAATTLTGSATLAAGPFTVKVRNGSGGTPSNPWTLTVTGTTAPSVELLGIEVTQGIQNLRNDIFLVQNKRTFVRAHIRSSSGTIYGVDGQLIGKRDNLLLPGSPLRPINAVGQVLENPLRNQLNDSFLFELPDSWRSGTIELEFKSASGGLICNDPDRDGKPNHDCRTQIFFETAPTLQIRFVGISYKENGISYSPTVDEYRQIVTILKDVYPISSVDWDYTERSYSARPTLDQVNSDLAWQRRFDQCWTVLDQGCKRIYYGVLIDPSGGNSDGGLAAGIPSWVASGYFPRGPRGVDYNGGLNLTPLIPPHEIAHTLGRHHAEFCNANALVKDIFGNLVYPAGYEAFPYAGGYISRLHEGEDKLLYGFSTSSLQVKPPQRGELMSYCAPLWISDWTYGKLLNAMRERIGTNIVSSKALLAEQTQTYILVGGSIDFSAATGRLDPAYIVDSDLQTEVPSSGGYKVRFVDSSGVTLADYTFEPNASSEPDQQGHLLGAFNLALPYDSNTSRIILMRGGVQLDSRAPAGASPTVRVISPNGGETLNGSNAIISWVANSPTANALTYVVQYSADAGATWQTLVTNWDSMSYTVNLSSIPGTTSGLIRVITSDGLHTQQDQSDTVFSVNRHLPQASILTPQNSALYVNDQTIILEGDGFDADDGQLGDDAMSWSSNLDGALGSGGSLSVNASDLQQGTHTITLTARDSDSQTGSAIVPIQVSRTRPTLPASLSVSPTSTSFSIGMGSIQTAADLIAVRNNGDGTLNWSASSDQTWIQLGAQNGSAPFNIPVAANPTGLGPGVYTGYVTITTSDAPNSPQIVNITLNVLASKTLQFNSFGYNVVETAGSSTFTVTRTGDLSSPASVDYATSDKTASQRSDYLASIGTLRFAAGENSKTITLFIINDSYGEGSETFDLTLSNPTDAVLGVPTTTSITINSDESVNGLNPVKDASFNTDFFVRQHYLDFLNRAPDDGGLAYWKNQIDECTTQECREIRRINVSAAFFLSIEFQETGYLVERLYKSAYGDADALSALDTYPSQHPIKAPIVRLNEFLADSQQIAKDLVVGIPGWPQLLENNKVAFTQDFVSRSRFTTKYPTTKTPTQFVNELYTNAGVTPLSTELVSVISEFGGAADTANTAARALALRRVAENTTLAEKEKNKAFVLMQYFGYLRRNPNDAADPDHTGYDFWLRKLNDFDGNFVNAEMVKAFIVSIEYQLRFGP